MSDTTTPALPVPEAALPDNPGDKVQIGPLDV